MPTDEANPGRNSPTAAPSPPMVARTLVADGDPLVRSVLGWLLTEDPRFELAGSVGTGDEAAAWGGPLDAALVDLAVPGLDALETVRVLRRRHRAITILVVADVDVLYFRSAAADAGADGYANRTTDASTLVDHLADLCFGRPARSGAAR